jgi:pyrroloquinoline quinone (PQQ) biosynthesis protein C
MNRHILGAAFVNRISVEALESTAANHPYLRAISEGDFPNMELAIKDFAFQYGLYSARFTRYVAAVIENLGNARHKQILLTNLDEEKGLIRDVELPPDVLTSVTGQSHASLFRRFQEALGSMPNTGPPQLSARLACYGVNSFCSYAK